ncbi:MAG: leucine-rich repeat domain-containing protein [Treponema sp.]
MKFNKKAIIGRIFLITIVLFSFTCRHTKKDIEKITITLKSDEHIKLKEPATFQIEKNTEWKKAKAIAISKIDRTDDDFEIKSWHLDNANGMVLESSYQFNKDSIVMVVSEKKAPTTASYKVEHWIQNIEDDGYTKKEEETKVSKIGLDTEATAKVYSGFKAKGITQEKVKADGKTLIKIEYDRKITSIILDLDGGETTTPLEAGEGKKKLLKGKFESKVKVENPKKENYSFVEWKPSLPEKFSAEDDSQVYVAQWKLITNIKINIKADERIQLEDTYINILPRKTFGSIKNELMSKVKLKTPEWNDNFYGVYDFKLEKEEGEKITDDFLIKEDITIYIRTNYTKFKFEDDKLKGYDGSEKPRGRIIIPKNTTSIGLYAFNDCQEIKKIDFSECLLLNTIGKWSFRSCRGVKHIDLSACKKLSKIENGAFYYCNKLRTIKFLGCDELTVIGKDVFGYCEQLDDAVLSQCNKLSKIGSKAFESCKYAIVKLPKNIQEIAEEAFGSFDYNIVKEVIVPNEELKQKVINSKYPKEKIRVES